MSKRTIYALAIAGAVLIAAVLIGGTVLLTRDSSETTAPTTTAPAVEGAVATNALLSGIPQKGTALGPAKAPVTLVEYADIQCPYCAQWAMTEFPSIVRGYVRPGQVRVVFQGLAFLGPDSVTALETVLSAGAQNRMWNVLELLFANQGAENSGWVTEELLRSVGNSVPGLDVDSLLAGRSSAAVAEARSEAQASAAEAGVQGTPSFAVGKTGGVLSLVSSNDGAAIRQALDGALRE